MISSINLYSQLYLAAQPAGQLPPRGPAQGSQSCRQEAEPGAGADPAIGKKGGEGHNQLSRIKVEDSFTTEQLEEIVSVIGKAPLSAVYTNTPSGHEDLFRNIPALKFIYERDQAAHKADCAKPAQGGHRHLYYYFRNPE